MFGRFAWLTTVIVAALSPAFCRAQSYDPQMPAPYSYAGFHQPVPPPGDVYAPQGPPGPYTYGRTRYTELPDDKGWAYGDTNLERFLKESFRHGYFRLEYLNWSVKDPGQAVLGAPILGPINDPNFIYQNTRIPFEIFDQGVSLGDGPYSGFGVSPTMDAIKGVHNNGIRGTWGWQFEPFAFETSVFALQTANGTVTPYGLPVTEIDSTDILGNPLPPVNSGTFTVQGLLVNGQPTRNTYWIYDESYKASIHTGIWGTDSKIVLARVDAGGPVSIQPLLGVKFFNFSERLDQYGQYRDPLVTGSVVLNRQINTGAQNYLYGALFGGRFELTNKWITLGAEPKVMFGANSYRSALHVENNRIVNNVLTTETQDILSRNTTFGPMADLQVYARGRLGDHLSVFVAYNLMWAGMITRPSNNIVYNVDSNGALAFKQDIHFTDVMLQGVSVGSELSW